jgi:hypothetical protein
MDFSHISTGKDLHNEKSRVVKICILKYKCIVVAILIVFSLIQTILLGLSQGRFDTIIATIHNFTNV